MVNFGLLTRTAPALGAIDFSIQFATLPSTAAIRFATAPSLTNSVVTAGAPGSAGVGFATYDGEDFASYDAAPLVNSVVPATSAIVGGALANPGIPATANVNLVGNGSIAATTTFSANTLKLNDSITGQTLTLGVGAVLNTNAILLPKSSRSFMIDGGSIGGTAARYFQVHSVENNELNASPIELSVSSNLATVTQPIVKSGPGWLVLTGDADQVGMASAAAPITISGGALRARIATSGFAPPINFGTSNLLQFRGGIFEVDCTLLTQTCVFERFLGDGLGEVNWIGAGGTGPGSGGFSAFGDGLIVRVKDPANPAPASPLVWDATPGFVRDGHALRFGTRRTSSEVFIESGRATVSAVDWQKPVQLDSLATGLPYAAREIEVFGIRLFYGDGQSTRYASQASFTRPITGSASTDLVKTGLGQLELAANNTFSGATIIEDGAIIATGDGTGGQALRNTSGITVNGDANWFFDPGSALILGDDNQINDLATLTLRNGVFITDIYSETLGSLAVANEILQFAPAFSVLRLGQTGDSAVGPGSIVHFADSTALSWSGLLRIEDWSGEPFLGGGHEQVYFGLEPGHLTQAQLDSIYFYSDVGQFLGTAHYLPTGEIVPMPEPGSVTLLALGATMLLRRRRSC